MEDRIDKQLEKDLKALEASQEPEEGLEGARPVDYYQLQRNSAYEASQRPTTYGAPAGVQTVVDKMVEKFKATDYNVNKNQYDHLKEYEANDAAEHLRQGYLNTEFLPLVEGLVENYGVDALLNNKRVLAKLDEVVISPNGSGAGFTKGYLMQMHKGQQSTPSQSDAEVAYGVLKAKHMADNGNVRGGVNLAKKLKERVDRGELSASESDYAELARGSAYGN